eukprot:Gb_38156 [translate_table: standard]
MKSSTKGKVLIRVVYAVKAMSIFVCNVIGSALWGSPSLLIDTRISKNLLWSASFMGLQKEISEEMRSELGKDGCVRVVKELQRLDVAVGSRDDQDGGGHPYYHLLHFIWISLNQIILNIDCFCEGEGFAIGVNYGRLANNLPTPSQVVQLLQEKGIRKAKIFDTDPQVLHAFRYSPVDLVVSVTNSELTALLDSNSTRQWLQERIIPFLHMGVRIKAIAIGNEIYSQTDSTCKACLLPACWNVYNALTEIGLQNSIKVSSPHAMDTINPNSYPPSQGSFNCTEYMKPLLHFLSVTGSFFMLNVYPFISYSQDPLHIDQDYATFGFNASTVQDGELSYTNLFDAMIDTVISAMEKLGFGGVPITISETGWPSAGAPAATKHNAERYINGLFHHLPMGTPRRPGAFVHAYVFGLFNENQKPDPPTERNFGLFYPNQTKVFNFDFFSMY